MTEQIDFGPTELTLADIDRFVEMYMSEEIRGHECFSCGKIYYGGYGHHMCNCDECFFKRFPKEQVERFCRSFLE